MVRQQIIEVQNQLRRNLKSASQMIKQSSSSRAEL